MQFVACHLSYASVSRVCVARTFPVCCNNFYNRHTSFNATAATRDKTAAWYAAIIFPQISADSDKGDFRVLIQRQPKAVPPLLGHTDPFKYKENIPVTTKRQSEIHLDGRRPSPIIVSNFESRREFLTGAGYSGFPGNPVEISSIR